MTTNLECAIIKPFGPSILKITVPLDIIKNVNDFADNQQDKIDNSPLLASRIDDVPQVSNEQLKYLGLHDMFLESSNHYLQTVSKYKITDLGIVATWLNNQMENEYNPVHFHMNCKLSAVLYLKMPTFEDRGPSKLGASKENIDGDIAFIFGTSDSYGFSSGVFPYKPTVGDLLIFPSTLFHTVYPFKGKGIRRTMAFNVDYNIIDPSSEVYK